MTDEHEQQDDTQVVLDEPTEQDEPPIIIEGEDDEAPADEAQWVRDLRKRERDQARDLADRNAEIAELRRGNQSGGPIEIGPKPDLWNDCEGDPDKYDLAKEAWDSRKRAVEAQQRTHQEQQEAASRTYQRAKSDFDVRARRIKDVDMVAAEQTVAAMLGPQWAGAIIETSPVSERVIAAMYKYPAQLQKIADEPHEVKRMRMILELEKKVTPDMNRRKPPEPEAETIQRGSAPMSRADPDKKLREMEKEWEKTGGSRAKISAYKRSLKERKK